MSVRFELEQGKVNSVLISSRKIMLNKGQLEVLEKLIGCVTTAMPSIEQGTIEALMKNACRDWEKQTVRPINEFRFIHANERMKSFDEIFSYYVARLNNVLVEQLSEEVTAFLRSVVLTNYKDYLEAEGYVVDYTP